MSSKIFVALSTFAEHGDEPLRLLRESGFDYSINPLGRRLAKDEIIEMGQDADGIIAGVEPYDDQVLDDLPRLSCISRCGVGIDNIALEKAKEKDIRILNTPDVVVQPVAELTIGMIFDLMRRITAQTDLIKAGRWEKRTGNLLKGRKTGVLGLGRIGKRVAEILVKLEADVLGADLSPDPKWAEKTGVKIVTLPELLRTAEVLTIHLSSVKDKPFQLGEKEIASMKKGALVVNVSRGGFIDENAVYSNLVAGHLGGCALDVFSEEPYSGKLCELENVIMTPHIATLTEESRSQMEVEATKNIIDFFKRGRR